jgi:hypothetical protein
LEIRFLDDQINRRENRIELPDTLLSSLDGPDSGWILLNSYLISISSLCFG